MIEILNWRMWSFQLNCLLDIMTGKGMYRSCTPPSMFRWTNKSPWCRFSSPISSCTMYMMMGIARICGLTCSYINPSSNLTHIYQCLALRSMGTNSLCNIYWLVSKQNTPGRLGTCPHMSLSSRHRRSWMDSLWRTRILSCQRIKLGFRGI